MRSSEAVGSGVTTTDNDDILAVHIDGFFRREFLAFKLAVLLGEELHGEVNAFKIPTFSRQVSWNCRSTREADRVVRLKKLVVGYIDTNIRVHAEPNAFTSKLIHSSFNNLFFSGIPSARSPPMYSLRSYTVTV